MIDRPFGSESADNACAAALSKDCFEAAIQMMRNGTHVCQGGSSLPSSCPSNFGGESIQTTTDIPAGTFQCSLNRVALDRDDFSRYDEMFNKLFIAQIAWIPSDEADDEARESDRTGAMVCLGATDITPGSRGDASRARLGITWVRSLALAVGLMLLL
jgi:hypothetical protein